MTNSGDLKSHIRCFARYQIPFLRLVRDLGELALQLAGDGGRLGLLVDVLVDLPEVVEVLDRLHLELGRRGLVHHERRAGVLLQGRHGPHVAHALLHRLLMFSCVNLNIGHVYIL